MCGIVAAFSPASTATTPASAASARGGGPSAALEAAVRRATDALLHRGPDGHGTWVAGDGGVALGHTRLALVDPLAHQPMPNEDESLRIVVNGELYDYPRIQAELRARGHVLRTRGDSEIALHLYEERGLDALADLRGEFAFILWDQRRRRLVAARDRFGIKPLFYAHVDGVLWLASEVKALVAAGVPRAWDHEVVFDSLHLAFDPSRTLFSGIRQVPPAHVLVADERGAIRVERYWDIPYPVVDASTRPNISHDDAVVEVRALLDDAVRLRLQADVPVGSLLSGGIDSSTVLALAARHADSPVRAFTIAFDGAAYDESPAAMATAHALGAEIHVLRLSDRELADGFEDAVLAGEGIQFNAHGTARHELSRAIRGDGYKTVMAGEGADELFLGYAFVGGALGTSGGGLPGALGAFGGRLSGALGAFGGRGPGLPAWLRFGANLLRPRPPSVARLAEVSPWLARVAQGFGFAGPAVDTLVARLDVVRGVLEPSFAAELRGRDPYRLLWSGLDRRAELRRWEPAKALLYLWLRTLFPNYHMAADRLDMAHAVEVRLPFLDHVLVERVAQYPVALLAPDGRNKHLLREAARPWLPEEVIARRKQPFLAPPAIATAGNPLHDLAQDALRGWSPPFVDRAAVIRLLDSLPARPATDLPAVEALLMALVSLTILDRRLRDVGTAAA